jgi:hypothetical protein
MKHLFLCALMGLVLAAPAMAQYCAPRNSQAPTTVAWPNTPFEEPVWQMEFLPPSSSTGTAGSGLEIRNVKYNGRLVMKRGHVPILNVKYESGCNCFRDWSYSDEVFLADNPVETCYAESTPGTVQTMCDAAPSNCSDNNGDGEVDSCSDVGSFEGVAVERFPDMLRLTTHYNAGWYRYTMKWEFHRDGTIRPLYGFATTGSACTQNPRRHHAYWRFDFDIEGAESDYIVETNAVGGNVVFENETLRTWGDPSDGVTWSVLDVATERGYRVAPGAADYDTPANPNTGMPDVDNFVNEDAVIARYQPGEIDDGGGSCSARFDSGSPQIVNDESVYDTDVVLWYRSGSTKPDIDPGTCYVVGPVLTPLGDWSVTPPVATDESATPTGFTLEDAYPNPFDQTTTVRFSVDEAQPVTLTLYDSVGRAVRTLYEGTPPAGALQTVVMDGSDLPSGVYTIRLEGESIAGTTRVVLLK